MSAERYQNIVDAKTRHANTATVTMTFPGEAPMVIAEIAGLTVRESGGTDGTYTVGTAYPLEHLHNRYTCNVSCNRFVWRDSAIKRFNISQRGLLDLPNFDITATDDVDNHVLFTVIGCTLSDRSQALQANQRIMSDMSFLGLHTQNAEQSNAVATGSDSLLSYVPNSATDNGTMVNTGNPVMAFMDLFTAVA